MLFEPGVLEGISGKGWQQYCVPALTMDYGICGEVVLPGAKVYNRYVIRLSQL